MSKAKNYNLIDFQKKINEQLLDEKNIKNDNICIVEKLKNLNFYFNIKNLKSITTNIKYEEVPIAKTWISGFNYLFGEIYTIIDFSILIEELLNNHPGQRYKYNNEFTNIIYFNEINKNRIAIISDKTHLENIENYQKIFEMKNDTTHFWWEIAEDYIPNEEETYSSKIADQINERIKTQEKQPFLKPESFDIMPFNEKIIYALIGDVYIKKNTQEVIFFIDIHKLLNILNVLN